MTLLIEPEKQNVCITVNKLFAPSPFVRKLLPFAAFFALTGMWLTTQFSTPPPTAYAVDRAIAGIVIDEQGEPVRDVDVLLYVNDEPEPVVETHTQPDGSYLLVWEVADAESMYIDFERPHFESQTWEPSRDQLRSLIAEGSLFLDDIRLVRRFQISFWIATLTFIGMLALIAFERLHKTLAALLAVAVIFSISLVGGFFYENLFIFDFEQALEHVDFDVIFLLLGMMIVIGIFEETGIFQWLAYRAYRLSRGKAWLLSIILIMITAVASALLDNVTTMLLMTPITLQIALAMGIDPLSLLLPEVLASNVGGISTLVGTPTNILIGSYAGLSFNDFLFNLTPGVIMALIGLVIYIQFRYRKQYAAAGDSVSPALLTRLEENARIQDPRKLLKASIVFGVLLIMFIFGEAIHLTPAVTAIIGAVAMLIWVHPHIEEMMSVVDWTTLVFFIGLFMVIGAVSEVGLIFVIANQIGLWVGDSLSLSVILIVWLAALMSGVVDNIPFAAAMLPVVDYLTRTVPGAGNNELFYALSVGAAMGGNSSLIGASANLVTAGISSRAGYPITFKKFLSIGFPATIVTVALGMIWLFIHF